MSQAPWLRREIYSLAVWGLEVQGHGVGRAGPSRAVKEKLLQVVTEDSCAGSCSKGFICYPGGPSGPASLGWRWWPVLVLTGGRCRSLALTQSLAQGPGGPA